MGREKGKTRLQKVDSTLEKTAFLSLFSPLELLGVERGKAMQKLAHFYLCFREEEDWEHIFFDIFFSLAR